MSWTICTCFSCLLQYRQFTNYFICNFEVLQMCIMQFFPCKIFVELIFLSSCWPLPQIWWYIWRYQYDFPIIHWCPKREWGLLGQETWWAGCRVISRKKKKIKIYLKELDRAYFYKIYIQKLEFPAPTSWTCTVYKWRSYWLR